MVWKARRAMTYRLFEDLVACAPSHTRRRARASWPVSIGLHAAGAAALLSVPLLTTVELPAEARNRVTFHMPMPAVVHAAERPPVPVRPLLGPARPSNGPARVMAATQPVPQAIPDGAPVSEDPLDALDPALPFGDGCPPGVECRSGVAIGDPSALAGGGAGEPNGRTVIAGRDVTPPLKLHHVPPAYPELARRVGLTGSVQIECRIAPDGRVVDARVVRGPALLEEAALRAVAQWRYRPTLLGGTPVSVLLTVHVHFNLAR
jgi:protein TonB